jgi:hypothetical protein
MRTPSIQVQVQVQIQDTDTDTDTADGQPAQTGPALSGRGAITKVTKLKHVCIPSDDRLI